MTPERFENVIIGSGEAGKYLAWTLGKKGQGVAVVERGKIGGACPNVACLPTKNVIYGAKVAAMVREAGRFGVRTGPVAVDMDAVRARKQAMVDDMQAVHLNNFHAGGTELVLGEGRFVGPRTIRVALNAGGERVLQGDRVFLDVGTRASLPPIPGLADARPMTHVEALDLGRLPAHLVILGGGYVGLEFAQALRRFGSRVTILNRSGRLLDREDPDVSEALLQLMDDEGVEVRLNVAAAAVEGRSGEALRITLDGGSVIEATDLLVAAGRTPNTDSLDADRGGVELDGRGFVRVNDRLETTADGVWAMGECAGSPQFTHVSFDDYRVVRDNVLGGSRSTAGRLVPYCLFTDPELAHVGLSESEAKAQGVPYRVARIPTARVLRAVTSSAPRGFLKALVAAAPDDRILGFTAFGVEASELLAAVQTAMMGGMPYTALRDGLFAHPTMAEGLALLFAETPRIP
ncbi:FAD-dependent oxidoreductase [Paludisphaera mucosa]|uniref:FAD-dependent oxidoreductase n=1 Tax=Paludisphaera mucosa TaxID=3030827 RepID=A0ABT6FB70_9BACT|nr:FAD-dependent oxidoreductase [Paludisphaera mucosa]MDG3004831.1 FAD-dependent oxidoreductase [Paludisphaera mucosa]